MFENRHACFSEITVFIPTSCDLTHSWIAAVQKSSFAHFCGYLPIFAGHLRAFCGKTFWHFCSNQRSFGISWAHLFAQDIGLLIFQQIQQKSNLFKRL
jgi:hypothetical protein